MTEPPTEVTEQHLGSDGIENRTLYVCDVSKDFEEFLELFLENPKKGGGTIESFTVYDDGLAQAVFENVESL